MAIATSESEKAQLTTALRHAHAANRKTYLNLINDPSDEARPAKEINRMVDQPLAIIADFEKSGYMVDILNRKRNRARRAEVVSAADAEIHLSALDISNGVSSYGATCSICCGDEQIMSIALKRLDTVDENTADFALNFPLVSFMLLVVIIRYWRVQKPMAVPLGTINTQISKLSKAARVISTS